MAWRTSSSAAAHHRKQQRRHLALFEPQPCKPSHCCLWHAVFPFPGPSTHTASSRSRSRPGSGGGCSLQASSAQSNHDRTGTKTGQSGCTRHISQDVPVPHHVLISVPPTFIAVAKHTMAPEAHRRAGHLGYTAGCSPTHAWGGSVACAANKTNPSLLS